MTQIEPAGSNFSAKINPNRAEISETVYIDEFLKVQDESYRVSAKFVTNIRIKHETMVKGLSLGVETAQTASTPRGIFGFLVSKNIPKPDILTLLSNRLEQAKECKQKASKYLEEISVQVTSLAENIKLLDEKSAIAVENCQMAADFVLRCAQMVEKLEEKLKTIDKSKSPVQYAENEGELSKYEHSLWEVSQKQQFYKDAIERMQKIKGLDDNFITILKTIYDSINLLQTQSDELIIKAEQESKFLTISRKVDELTKNVITGSQSLKNEFNTSSTTASSLQFETLSPLEKKQLIVNIKKHETFIRKTLDDMRLCITEINTEIERLMRCNETNNNNINALVQNRQMASNYINQLNLELSKLNNPDKTKETIEYKSSLEYHKWKDGEVNLVAFDNTMKQMQRLIEYNNFQVLKLRNYNDILNRVYQNSMKTITELDGNITVDVSAKTLALLQDEMQTQMGELSLKTKAASENEPKP